MANENERQLLDLGFKTLMDGGVADHPQKSVDKLCALWGVFVSFQVEPEVRRRESEAIQLRVILLLPPTRTCTI